MGWGCLLLGNHDIGRVVGDGAGVRSVLEADETRLAPGCAPGVTHLSTEKEMHTYIEFSYKEDIERTFQ